MNLTLVTYVPASWLGRQSRWRIATASVGDVACSNWPELASWESRTCAAPADGPVGTDVLIVR